VGYLAATVEPAAPLPELVNDFSQSSAGVVLSLDFTAAGQTGDISFQLDSALTIDPVAIAITLDPSGEATGPLSLTLEDNSAEDSGCAYQLTTLGGDYIVYDLIRCWGEFKADSVPTSVRTITVRAEANASGHSKLWVSRIDW
jgi:hypothetical protein